MKITARNESRKSILEYIAIDREIARLESRKAELKAELVDVFTDNAVTTVSIEKTVYTVATVQESGKAVAIARKVTERKGTVDNKALHKAYGITPAMEEEYRKPNTTATVIEVLSESQLKKLGLL